MLTLSAFGALLFVAPDMLTGCLNMQPMGVPTCWPPLTPFYFFFVYFGVRRPTGPGSSSHLYTGRARLRHGVRQVLINWIWFFVPVGMLAVRVRAEFRSGVRAPRDTLDGWLEVPTPDRYNRPTAY